MNTETQDPREGLPSASSATRRRYCPGSRLAESEVPAATSSDIADQGTRIHKAIETGDLSVCEDDEERSIAEKIGELMAAEFDKWLFDIPKGQFVGKSRERRFWIKHPQTLANMESAQVDFVAMSGDRCLILDAKSGFLSATPSAGNYQLRVQALAVACECPSLKHFRVGIVQHRFKSEVTLCDYTQEDMRYALQEFLLADWSSRQEDAPRNAGDHCKYCRAKPHCRTAGVWSLIPGQLVNDLQTRVEELPLEALTFIQSRRGIANTIFEAVNARLKTFSEADLATVGLARSKGGEAWTITDVPKVHALLVPGLMNDAQFWTCTKMALGGIEDVALKPLAEQMQVSQKKAKEALREMLRPACTIVPRSGSLIQLKAPKEIGQ